MSISFTTFQKLAGAVHVKSEKGETLSNIEKANIVLRGAKYGTAPYYGEVEYQYRMSRMGWDDSDRER